MESAGVIGGIRGRETKVGLRNVDRETWNSRQEGVSLEGVEMKLYPGAIADYLEHNTTEHASEESPSAVANAEVEL
jgi:hypothetical protein